MTTKIEAFTAPYIKKNPDIRAGDTVKVYQKIKEGDKERIQIFEGLVLAKKHGKEAGSMLTVRKIAQGVGVERIFPLHSPLIDKIEIVKRTKVRRAKLYYLRDAKGKKGKLRARELKVAPEEEPKIETPEAIVETPSAK